MGSLDILALLSDFWKEVGPLKDLLLQVLGGDNSQLSSEGSLAGSSAAQDIAGSTVGSAVGSLGGADLVNKIPTNNTEAYTSADNLGILDDILGGF
ncbi:hypothetical protein [Corynebacterium nuruki]|uniref:hypothetical protein n=1 Tax=Corynebacterium nuruki TaxID=1032851 RepID=UPI0039BEF945